MDFEEQERTTLLGLESLGPTMLSVCHACIECIEQRTEQTMKLQNSIIDNDFFKYN